MPPARPAPSRRRPRTSRARAALAPVPLGAVLLLATVGCAGAEPPAPSPTTRSTTAGGPTGTTGTAPRTTPPRSDAKITTFDAPGTVACNGLVRITVTARYTTTGAASVAFLVDNEQVAGTPPTNGSFEIPMRCDGATHTVVLSAIDDQGRAAVASKAILTDDRQSGG